MTQVLKTIRHNLQVRLCVTLGKLHTHPQYPPLSNDIHLTGSGEDLVGEHM